MILTDLEKREISKYVGLFDYAYWIKDKTFLITGAKGIVGSGIIKWLLYENEIHNANIHIVASTRDKTVRPSYVESTDNIEFCTFGQEIEECEGKSIDYIIHAAAPTSNKFFQSKPVESLKIILDGTERMLEMTRQYSASMIYLSSEEAYGTPDLNIPIKEEYVGAVNSLNTRNCYPLGKKVAELFCHSYSEEYGVDVKIIRPTVIMGLWQEYDSVKVEAEILRCIIENKNLFMKSDGLTKKCVIYTLDAISAVLTVLFKGVSGEAYNATNPSTFCSVKDRAYKMFAEFNPNITIEFAETDTAVAQGYLPKRALLEDISKIQNLGWNPLTNCKEIYKIDLERFKAI